MTEIVQVKAREELEDLARFAAVIWHEHYDTLLGTEQVDYMLDKFQSAQAMEKSMTEGYRIYRSYEDTEPCGYIAICPHDDHMYLSKFYMNAAFRRRGIGRKMMEFIENEAKREGFDRVRLNVNKYNCSIEPYRHLGFEIVADEVNDIGRGFVMDDYVMEKRL